MMFLFSAHVYHISCVPWQTVYKYICVVQLYFSNLYLSINNVNI